MRSMRQPIKYMMLPKSGSTTIRNSLSHLFAMQLTARDPGGVTEHHRVARPETAADHKPFTFTFVRDVRATAPPQTRPPVV